MIDRLKAICTCIGPNSATGQTTQLKAMMTRAVTSAENSVDENEDIVSPAKRKNRSLDRAISIFQNLDSTTVIRGNVRVHLATEDVVKHSMSYGLTPSQITDLVEIIVSTRTKLSQATRSKFVRCLIPCTKVPQSAVVRVLSLISSKVFTSPGPSTLDGLLLRWILLVFDHIDSYDYLHKLYPIIFMLVNSSRLLPHACHLLFLLTTKQDVRLFRVLKLLNIIKLLGPEPPVVGLLMIYKVYCPHLVSMKLEFGHKAFFKAHDVVWRKTIEDIVQRSNNLENSFNTRQIATDITNRMDRAKVESRKRAKLMVPSAHSAAHEVQSEDEDITDDPLHLDQAVPYPQLESFTAFLEAIDKVKHPSQAATCLMDNRLQLLLMCNPDPMVHMRLCFWIQHVIVFDFKGNNKDSRERNEKLLQLLYFFSQNVQSLPVVIGFLETFLPTWDGQLYGPYIFSLITTLKPSSFSELYFSILAPLQRIFYTLDVYGKTMCVQALTNLIRNLCLTQKSESISETRRTNPERPEPRSKTQQKDTGAVGDRSQEESDQSVSQISGKLDSLIDLLHRLVNFLDVMVVLGMRMEDDHYLLQATSLELLSLIPSLHTRYNIPLVVLPMHLVYRLLLSDCPAILARLCGSINTFREAFLSVKHQARELSIPSRTYATAINIEEKPGLTATDKFNSLLLDVLKMLWQGRMFSRSTSKYPSMFDFPIPNHLQGKVKSNAMTLYTNPAFLGLAYTFLKETQREGKKAHPAQIEEFKEIYLQFLARENFPEFLQLVNTNTKHRLNVS